MSGGKMWYFLKIFFEQKISFLSFVLLQIAFNGMSLSNYDKVINFFKWFPVETV